MNKVKKKNERVLVTTSKSLYYFVNQNQKDHFTENVNLKRVENNLSAIISFNAYKTL